MATKKKKTAKSRSSGGPIFFMYSARPIGRNAKTGQLISAKTKKLKKIVPSRRPAPVDDDPDEEDPEDT